MKWILVLLLMTLVSGLFASEWFTDDKIAHGVISFGLSVLLSDVFNSEYLGFAFSFGMGIGKESIDFNDTGQINYRDLTWNLAGTLAGCTYYHFTKDKLDVDWSKKDHGRHPNILDLRIKSGKENE